MRCIATSLFLILVVAVLSQPAKAQGSFQSVERLMDWMYHYRKNPNPERLPAAFKAMKDLGLFADNEQAGFGIGFIAGVLHDNERRAPALVSKMFPTPPKEQAAIIKGIAYSGLPDWKGLLTQFQDKMAIRQPLIDDYLNDRRAPLMEIPLTDGAAVLYVLWGYYVATGDTDAVVRVMQALEWSSDKDEGFTISRLWRGKSSDFEKASIGGTAKWTLASYAERDRELLTLYRAEYERQPERVARALRDVIIAAERFEAEEIRRQETKTIEEAQRRHLQDPSGMSKAHTAGSVGIATACVVASATGFPQIGVPCVIGGALYTGAVRLLSD
jgi:hypothetical protein